MSTVSPSSTTALIPTSASSTPSATPTIDPQWLNDYKGDRLIAVSATFIGLTTVFVLLRLWSRRINRASIGWDDYLIIPALATCWISEATCIAIVPKGGVGTRAEKWILTGQESMIGEWAKYIYVVEMCYLVAACATKLALLAVYIRVLRDRLTRRIVYFMMGLTVVALIGETVACSLQCIPFSYQWDKEQPGTCFDQLAFYRYLSIPNILSDLFLLVLPIPTVLKLHTTRGQKIQLFIVFALGSFGVIASILRFTNFFTTNALADPTMNSVVLLTWTVIEPGMYLISACLPMLRPLLNFLLAKMGLRGQTKSGSGPSDQGKGAAIPLNHTIGSKRFNGGFKRLQGDQDSLELESKHGITVTQDFMVYSSETPSEHRSEHR